MTLSFRKNIVWVGLSQYLSYLFPLLITPYLARVLGVANFGDYQIAISYIMICMIIVEFGLNAQGIRFVASEQYKERLSGLISAIFLFRLLTLIIVLVALFVYSIVFLFERNSVLAYCVIASFPMLCGAAMNTSWFLQGIGKARLATLPQLITRCITLPALFLIVKSPNDAWIASIITSMPMLLGCFINLWQSKKNGFSFTVISRLDITTVIKSGAPVFLSMISIQAYTNLLLVIAELNLADNLISNYAAADRVIKLFFQVISPLTIVLLPIMSSAAENDSFLIKFKKTILLHVLVASVFSAVTFLFSDLIVTILFGDAFKEASQLLKLLAFLPILSAISHCLNTHGLVASGENLSFMIVTIIGAIAGLLIIKQLISTYSVVGIAYTSYIVEILVVLMAAYFFTRKVIYHHS